MNIGELTRTYYEVWAAQDQDQVHKLLHRDLIFVSPQDRFDSADGFLSACWQCSRGLAGVKFVKEIYQENRAFVIPRWLDGDGGTFVSAEYLEVVGGSIKLIVVVNNDPLFKEVVG